MRMRFAGIVLIALLNGCKEDIPPSPAPQSKAVTGIAAPCEDLAFHGFPRKSPPSPGTFFICRDSYALSWNPANRTADWVVQRLDADRVASVVVDLNGADDRPDPLLPIKLQIKTDDYRGTGYERALLAGARDAAHDYTAWSHAHYLSNAVPIHPAAAKAWGQAGDSARALASAHGKAFVVSGPVYMGGVGRGWVGVADNTKATGARAFIGKVQVPSHLFKVVFIEGQVALAFMIPNSTLGQGPVASYITSAASVERATGIRMTPDLDLQQQAAIKVGVFAIK